MAVSPNIALGDNLDKEDLTLVLKTSTGFTDADVLPTFEVFLGKEATGTPLTTGTATIDPGDIGIYYPNVAQPGTAAGAYTIKWTFIKDTVTHTASQTYFVFATLDLNVFFTLIPPEARPLIDRLRFQLRDFDPEHYYTLNPQLDVETRERVDKPQAFLFEDQELFFALEDALDRVNSVAPVTNFSFKSVRKVYRSYLTQFSRWIVLQAKATNWIAQEFTYNLTTNTLDLQNRYQKYLGIAETQLNNFDTQLTVVKPNIERVIKGTGRFFKDGAPRIRPLRFF